MRGPCRTIGIIALFNLTLGCSETPRLRVIDVQNFQYNPAQAELVVGDTILFANHDVVPHTATARDRSWDTGEIAPGDTVRVTIRSGGEYFCLYHPNMTASVSLTER